MSTVANISKKEVEWIWRRLHCLVIEGFGSRELRNKFGLAYQGKGTVTEKDLEDALYHININN